MASLAISTNWTPAGEEEREVLGRLLEVLNSKVAFLAQIDADELLVEVRSLEAALILGFGSLLRPLFFARVSFSFFLSSPLIR